LTDFWKGDTVDFCLKVVFVFLAKLINPIIGIFLMAHNNFVRDEEAGYNQPFAGT
jgi:hypothetical protein